MFQTLNMGNEDPQSNQVSRAGAHHPDKHRAQLHDQRFPSVHLLIGGAATQLGAACNIIPGLLRKAAVDSVGGRGSAKSLRTQNSDTTRPCFIVFSTIIYFFYFSTVLVHKF